MNLTQPRDIQTFGAGCLREVSEEVTTEELMELHTGQGEIHDLIQDMLQIVTSEGNGVGLSANQIGVMKRIIVMQPRKQIEPDTPPIVLINPELIDYTDRNMSISYEGCLSLPGIYFHVERPNQATVTYCTPESAGVPVEAVFDDIDVTVLLHEIDHLNGILFVDRCLNHEQRRWMKRKFKMGKIPKIPANDYQQGA